MDAGAIPSWAAAYMRQGIQSGYAVGHRVGRPLHSSQIDWTGLTERIEREEKDGD
jgi:hypothetical protein